MKFLLPMFLFLALPAWADDLGGYLGGVFLRVPEQSVTIIKKPDGTPFYFSKMEDCIGAAVKLNQNSPWLREPEQIARGAEVVCLPIVRGSV